MSLLDAIDDYSRNGIDNDTLNTMLDLASTSPMEIFNHDKFDLLLDALVINVNKAAGSVSSDSACESFKTLNISLKLFSALSLTRHEHNRLLRKYIHRLSGAMDAAITLDNTLHGGTDFTGPLLLTVSITLVRLYAYKFHAKSFMALVDGDVGRMLGLLRCMLVDCDIRPDNESLLFCIFNAFRGLSMPSAYFEAEELGPRESSKASKGISSFYDEEYTSRIDGTIACIVASTDTLSRLALTLQAQCGKAFTNTETHAIPLSPCLAATLHVFSSTIHNMSTFPSHSVSMFNRHTLASGVARHVLAPHVVWGFRALDTADDFFDQTVFDATCSSLAALIALAFRGNFTHETLELHGFLISLYILEYHAEVLRSYDYLFGLVMMLSVNLDAFSLDGMGGGKSDYSLSLRARVEEVVNELTAERCVQVMNMLECHTGSPLARDLPSYQFCFDMLISRSNKVGEFQLPPEWSAVFSEESGAWYYWNSVTGVTQWDHPMCSTIADDSATVAGPGTEARGKEVLGSIMQGWLKAARSNLRLRLPRETPRRKERRKGGPSWDSVAGEGKSEEKEDGRKAWPKAHCGLAVPPSFLCAINSHVMRNPVSTPQGFVMERETIELWLKEHGSTCPITGKGLSLKELKDDLALRKAITEWHIRVTTSQELPDFTSDALYDF